MSMTPAEVERKVRQLDNDVQSIYELLNGITTTQMRHTNRFNELAEQVDRKFDSMDQRLDTMDQRFDAMEAKLDTVLDLLRDR
jgi:uncharacterized damage-inducible protein DinB